MAYDKFWMIVEVSEAGDHFQGQIIPEKKAPRFMHPNREQAEKELLRLQSNNPDCEFVLLEAMARAEKRTLYVVESILEIPF